MALTENSFAGIVGGVSGVRSEQILGGFSGRAPVPQEAGAVISDPVRGNVSEADISGEAGPLPEAPEPDRGIHQSLSRTGRRDTRTEHLYGDR